MTVTARRTPRPPRRCRHAWRPCPPPGRQPPGAPTTSSWRPPRRSWPRSSTCMELGRVRAAWPDATAPGGWRAEPWVKAAILLAFRMPGLTELRDGPILAARDRSALGAIDLLDGPGSRAATAAGAPWRIVPGGTSVRRGAYLAPGVAVIPPAFVNAGAWVGEGTMIDSHVLVGSCAQVGRDVHLSAAVQVGGVLEPPGARPVVVEDGAFVGGGSGLYEGVVVGRGAVIGAGVVLTGQSRLVDLVRGARAARHAGGAAGGAAGRRRRARHAAGRIGLGARTGHRRERPGHRQVPRRGHLGPGGAGRCAAVSGPRPADSVAEPAHRGRRDASPAMTRGRPARGARLARSTCTTCDVIRRAGRRGCGRRCPSGRRSPSPSRPTPRRLVLETLRSAGLGADVASGGELSRRPAGGLRPRGRIVLHRTGQDRRGARGSAAGAGIRALTIESLDELDAVLGMADLARPGQGLLLRLAARGRRRGAAHHRGRRDRQVRPHRRRGRRGPRSGCG